MKTITRALQLVVAFVLDALLDTWVGPFLLFATGTTLLVNLDQGCGFQLNFGAYVGACSP